MKKKKGEILRFSLLASAYFVHQYLEVSGLPQWQTGRQPSFLALSKREQDEGKTRPVNK
jgi:hypothetical protein